MRQQAGLRLAGHGVLHRAQLAPFGEVVFQRLGHRPPAAGVGARIGFGQRGFTQALDQRLTGQQVLFALCLQGLQVRGHRLVGGLQRGVKTLPQGAAGGAAQVVQFLPAVAHVLDDFGLLLDGQLDRARFGRAARHGGQRLGLLGQLVAGPAPGPVLPALELCVAALHGVDARAQCGVTGAAMQQFVDGQQMLVGVAQVAFVECGFGLFEQAGQGIQLRRALGALVLLGHRALLAAPLLTGQRQSLLTGLLPARKTLLQGPRMDGVGQWGQGQPACEHIRRRQRGWWGCFGQGGGCVVGRGLHRRCFIGTSLDCRCFIGTSLDSRRCRLCGIGGQRQQLVQQGQAFVQRQRGLHGLVQRFAQRGGLRVVRRGRQGRLRGATGLVHQRASLLAGRGFARDGLQFHQRLAGLGGPALDAQGLFAAFQRGGGDALLQCRELRLRRSIQVGGIQRLPGIVQFDQAVDRRLLFGQQGVGAGDQCGGLGGGFALGNPMREPLLGQPVHTALVIAQSALGQLEGCFARQGFDRGEFRLQRGSAFGQCEQGRVVTKGRLQAGRPVDDFGRHCWRRSGLAGWCGGLDRCGLRRCSGRTRGRLGQFEALDDGLLEDPAEHGRVMGCARGEAAIVRLRPSPLAAGR